MIIKKIRVRCRREFLAYNRGKSTSKKYVRRRNSLTCSKQCSREYHRFLGNKKRVISIKDLPMMIDDYVKQYNLRYNRDR